MSSLSSGDALRPPGLEADCSMQDRRDAGSPGEASSQSREFESEAKPATARAVSYGSAKETGSPNEDQGDSRVPWTRPRGAQFP